MDSITEFLKSPVWKNPIVEFIDDNCMCFDNEEENKLEYTNIHKVSKTAFLYPRFQNFKKLVDEKLDQFILDMGITGEAFVMACEMAS